MKKILAILLASALLVSVLAVIAVPAFADEAKPFWLSHYNDLTAEGAGVVVTTSGLEGGTWNNYYAFTPVEGTDAYEITAISIGIGTGTASQPAIPEGGFVYSINLGNDYPALYESDPTTYSWCEGMPNYTSTNCNNMVADIATWKVGDKFTFTGIDLTGLTVPTSTAGTNWYDAAYVCTATYSVYVAEGEEPSVDPDDVDGDGIPDSYGATKDDLGDYTFTNAYGYEFTINYVDGTIAGEDATLITNVNSYATSNPNWAISVALAATDVAGEYAVEKVVVTPGSADAAAIDWNTTAAVLVVHSASSQPGQYANWMSKVAAMALKAGDIVVINDAQTLATVKAPAVEDESSEAPVVSEDESSEDPVASEEESSEAPVASEDESSEAPVVSEDESEDVSVPDTSDDLVGEPNADAMFDAVISYEGDLTVGSTVNVTVSINNITAERGLHLVKLILNYDPSVLKITNDLDELENNCLDAIASVPTDAWENFCKVAYDFDEDTEIATAKNDGIVELSALTEKTLKSQAASEDGAIAFALTFEVIGEADETAIYIANDTVQGASNTSDDVIKCVGNGSSVIVTAAQGDESSEAPVVSEDESSEAPVVSEDESSEAPVVSEDESSEAPVVSEDESSEAPVVSEDESSEAPVVSEDESSEAPVVSEDESEDVSVPDTGINGDELVGEPNANSMFDAVISYEGDLTVGSTVNVTVSINNITAERGLHLVKLILNYDPSVLKITNDLDELENNCLLAIGSVPTDAWENFCKVAYDFDEDTEIATAKNDGIVELSALTEKTLKSQAASEDGAITFVLTFEVTGEADETAIYIPSASVQGASNTSDDVIRCVGNGSYVIVTATQGDESSEAPVVSEDESSEAPVVSEDESSEAPVVSEDESSEAPVVSEDESSEAPVVSEDESSEAPVVSEDESSEAPEVSGDASEDESSEAPEVSGDASEDESSEAPEVSGDASEDESSEAPEVSGDASEDASADASTEASADESKDDSSAGTPQTGDVSSMIVFVVLAIVALAGSAVIVKTRK